MAQIEALYAAIDARHSRLDVLVNNAATNPYFGPITDTDPAIFQKTVDVNIRGYFYMSSHAAKRMGKNGGGSIVNVASVNGVVPGFQQGIYSITKAAVISMTKAFAVECAASGVRCNALLPGLTDTKFAAVLVNTPAILKQALAHVPMRRVAQPSEMAGAVLYLASPASSYTTGSALNVDGGYLSV
jgi:Dehydrogenases with different specificities (related to short-chain alcohol dehydrogenases)